LIFIKLSQREKQSENGDISFTYFFAFHTKTYHSSFMGGITGFRGEQIRKGLSAIKKEDISINSKEEQITPLIELFKTISKELKVELSKL
jgi:hypothetical protein